MTRWKKASRRGLSVFLTLALCLNTLNLTAFAEEMPANDSGEGPGETYDLNIPLPQADPENGVAYPLPLDGFVDMLTTDYSKGEFVPGGTWSVEGTWEDGSLVMEIDPQSGEAVVFEPAGKEAMVTVVYSYEEDGVKGQTLPENTKVGTSDEVLTENIKVEKPAAPVEQTTEEETETTKDVETVESADETSEEETESVEETSEDETESAETMESVEESSEEETEATESVEETSKDETESAETTESVEESSEEETEATESVEETSKDETESAETTESVEETSEDETEATESVEETSEEEMEATESVEESSEKETEATESVEESSEDETEATESVEENIEDETEAAEPVKDETEKEEKTAEAAGGTSEEDKADNAKASDIVSADAHFVKFEGTPVKVSYKDAESEETAEKASEKDERSETVVASSSNGQSKADDSDTTETTEKTKTGTMTWKVLFTSEVNLAAANDTVKKLQKTIEGWSDKTKPIEIGSTIIVTGTEELDLMGCTIKYIGTTGSVFHVTGGTFTLKGNGNISGGKGTKVKWSEIVDRDKTNGEPAGGAVLVDSGATFNMYGGTITDNNATWGGGIAVARGGFLNIYGGTISNNTATSSDNDNLSGAATGKYGGGGGIFCAGIGLIKPTKGNISITGNSTGTINDLGGGGIFIENKGSMQIFNAVITGNTASGQGGGVAGCLHGKMSNISPQTAAIYGNTAENSKRVTRLSNVVDHNDWWWKKDKVSNANDYFCAGYSVVGKRSMNDGDAKWTGWKATSSSSGVSTVSGDPIVVKGVLGLTAGSGNNVGAKANSFKLNNKVVTISGNTSKMHGGGIGCNGTLSFGEEGFNYFNSNITLKATKFVKTANGSDSANGYQFLLLDSSKRQIATVTSNQNGVIQFPNLSTTDLFGNELKEGSKETTLYLREVVPSSKQSGIIYDEAERKIIIKATRKDTPKEITTGTGGVNVTTHEFKDTITSVEVWVGDRNVFSVKNPGKTITLTGDANFTNKKVGSLTVTKKAVIESEYGTAQKTEFGFSVKLGNSNEKVGTFTAASIVYQKDGIYSFNLSQGQSFKITDIPAGTKYTVKETDSGEYTASGEVENGTIKQGDTNSVEVTNTRKTGKIEITKAVSGVTAANISGQKFTFQVKNSQGTVIADLPVGINETATIGNLPYGTYTITEVSGEVENLVWNGVSFGNGEPSKDNKSITVNVGENNKTYSVTATNHYEPVTKLTVKKVVEEFGNTPDQSEFWFTVTMGDGSAGNVPVADAAAEISYKKNAIYRFKLGNGATFTIKDIPVGTTYKVKEDPYDQYIASDGAETDGTITKGENSVEVEVTNTRKTGKIQVAKSISGIGENLIPTGTKFTFKVEGANAVKTVDVGVGETGEIDHLPYGTYTVTEISGAVENLVWNGVSFEKGQKPSASNSITVTIGEEVKTYKVTADNNYVPVRDLKVTKEVVEVDGTTAQEKFGFTVKMGDGTAPVEIVDGVLVASYKENGSYYFKLAKDETFTIKNIPVGITYTVKEDESGQYTPSGEVEDPTAITAEGENSVVITNTRKTGSIRVIKSVSGVEENLISSNKKFVFEVKREGALVARLHVRVGEDGAAVTGKLPYGDYTITEVSGTVENLIWNGVSFAEGQNPAASNSITVTVGEKDKTYEVTADNNYVPVRDLKVTKKVVEVDDTTAQEEFGFTVKMGDGTVPVEIADGATVASYKENGSYYFKLANDETFTIKDIPVGVTYTVVEDLSDEYTPSDEVKDPIPIEENGENSVIVTNTRKTGKIQVAKSVSGVDGSLIPEGTQFTFQVKRGDEVVDELHVENGGIGTTKELPYGDYTITEVSGTVKNLVWEDVSFAEGQNTPAGNSITVTVNQENKIYEVTADNSYVPVRDLKVTKRVVEVDDTTAQEEFGFTVKMGDGTVPVEIADGALAASYEENGVYHFMLTKDATFTIEDIPVGVRYTVEEDESEEYTASGEITAPTAIEEDGENSVEVTNTRKTGRIRVVKAVSGIEENLIPAETTFTFQVKKGENLVAELSVGVGEDASDMVENLPYGDYTITEVSGAVENLIWNGVSFAEGQDPAASNSITVTVDEKDKTYEVTADNNYVPVRDLKVTKRVVEVDNTTAQEEFGFTVKMGDGTVPVEIADGATAASYEENGSYHFMLTKDTTFTIENIPVGIEYTVEEDESDEYTASGEITTPAAIEEDGENSVEVTNTRKTGEIQITKAVSVSHEGSIQKDVEFTFEVRNKADDLTADPVATLSIKDGESKRIELPYGQYTITEVRKDVSGAFWNGVSFEEGQTPSADNSITVEVDEEGKTYEVTAQNYYVPVTNLTVTKRVHEAEVGTPAQTEFGFTVKLGDGSSDVEVAEGSTTASYVENGNYYFKLKADETFTIEDILVGTAYTVVEDSTEMYIASGEVEAPVEISAEENSVEVTNTRKTGKIQIAKAVTVSDGSTIPTNAEFTFQVKNAAGDVVDELTVKNDGQTVTTKELPYGEYTVAETKGDVSGMIWYGVSFKEGEAPSADNSIKVTVDNEGETYQVTATNHYVPATSLTVNKVWEGDSERVRPTSVSVQLYRDGEAYESAVVLNAGNGWSHTWENLDSSYTWTVEEINVPENYDSAVRRTGNVVTVTNTYRPEESTTPEETTPTETTPEETSPTETTPEETTPTETTPEETTPTETSPETPENPPRRGGGGGGNPTRTNIPDENVPLTEIPGSEVPLAGLPNVEEVPVTNIFDPDVPLANIPKTGDDSNVWNLLILLSGAGLALLALLKKKKESNAE